MSTNECVRVFQSQAALTEEAAAFIVEAGKKALNDRGRFLLALSGGGTPEPVYRLLAGEAYRGRLEWAAVFFFWGDERCVPPADAGSNYGQARALILDPLAISTGQIVRIKGELAPEEAAADYRQRLGAFAGEGSSWPRLDLALMGLGSDGHTASLFPGPPTAGEDRLAAIAVTANYEGRPARRVSLTPPVFNSARNVLFLVSGPAKAEAVAAVLRPDADPIRWPAARIQPAPGESTWFLDRPAARLLD